LAQIEDWMPGIGETGTYLVERTKHPNVAFKARYVADLMKGVNWGLDDSRTAWGRALATCDAIHPNKDKQKRISQLKQEKSNIVAKAQDRIKVWVNTLFGTSSLETNLIESMKMTYTITGTGANAGKNRRSFNRKIRSSKPNPIAFGLKEEPQKIWTQLVNANVGVFAQGNSSVALMVARVPYPEKQRKPAQVLRAFVDGWGV